MNTIVTKSHRCKHCKSTDIAKYGRRKNKSGDIQIYLCKSCGRFFSENTTYDKAKLKEFATRASISLRSCGLSYRKIQKHLREVYGINVSHVTIFYWVRSCRQEE